MHTWKTHFVFSLSLFGHTQLCLGHILGSWLALRDQSLLAGPRNHMGCHCLYLTCCTFIALAFPDSAGEGVAWRYLCWISITHFINVLHDKLVLALCLLYEYK